MSTVRTFSNPAELAEAAAQHVVAKAQAAIAARGRFILALSGGTTPLAVYSRLAEPDMVDQLDWLVTHVFWGDERAVPPSHEDSNYRMACDALLDHVPIPPQNIHRISGEMPPAAAAAEYEAKLRDFFKAALGDRQQLLPRFDLVLLGMGEDGHTASLFPGAPAIHEERRWVAAYHVDSLKVWRITLTPVAINAAHQVTFLVTGAEKAPRLRQVLYGSYQPSLYPAQIIRPDKGRLLWMIDEAAAGRL